MKLSDLIAAAREDVLHDTKSPYGWSDEAIARFLTQAQEQACERGGILVDSVTQEDDDALPICRINLEAGVHTYTLSRKVLRVVRASLASQPYPPLIQKTAEQLDEINDSWNTATGPPVFFIVEGRNIRFVPEPTADDFVDLTVSRLPLRALTMSDAQAEPEIEEQYHLELLNWVAFRAFSKRDVDAEQARYAADGLAAFTARFGPAPTARAVALRRNRPARIMRAKAFGESPIMEP